MLIKVKEPSRAIQVLKENGIEVEVNPALITEMFKNELEFHIENGLYSEYEWNDAVLEDVAFKLMEDEYTIDMERVDQVIENYFRGIK